MKASAAITMLLLLAGPVLLNTCVVHAQQSGRYGHYDVYDTDLLPREEYAARRAQALARMEKNTAILVRSAEARVRSNDVDYEYRQRNNMLYLTGVTEE